MSRVVLKASEGMAKIVEGINVTAPLETLKAFAKFLQNIPDDIKDTILFGKVQDLKKMVLVSNWVGIPLSPFNGT